MKKLLYTMILILLSCGIFSQGVYNNGGKIVIGSGVTLYIDGAGGNYRNETNVTGGTMDLAGTFKVAGNLTNNVAAADIFSSTVPGSEVVFIGTTPQTASGTTTTTITFPNLTINNPAGIVLAKNTIVNGNMNFTSGLVDIGNNNFTFGLLSAVAGTPSATSMIVATGTGQVMRDWVAIGSFTFPVGDNNIAAKYSPVTLNFTSGTFAAGAYAGLNLANAKFADPAITGSYINRYWNVIQSGITACTCDGMFQYLLSDVVGTESNISALRILPSPLTPYGLANTTLHQLTAAGLTSFGTFTGGPGFKLLNLKLFLQGTYIGGGLMAQAQGVAGNQFPGTTADQISVELHDPVTYLTTVYSVPNVNLNTSGQATLNVPASYGSSYYITVKQRNSIGIVTALPVSLSSQTINYDFTTSATQAFGSNMVNLGGGVFGLFGGDATGDGAIDALDLISVENSVIVFASGYMPADINGDGVVDALDLILCENNVIGFVSTITP